ncbi:copper resistance protein CopC [Leifsonia sp. NPDC058292]|uniref:copper resistance CopC family protein n=1 Tax=Leifsonia sp. NPDC058292 TaxID=3346428 RepID=UPI0036DB941F
MIRPRALGASIAALGLAAALALLPAAGATAHDYLVSSDPAADSTVSTALDKVSLTFNDRVLDLSGDGSSSLVTVTGPDASTRHFETGCATTADTTVSAPVALGGAGKYTITYQIVSADGHTVSNSLAFSYQPPAGATPAEGTESSACGTSSAAPTPSGEVTTQATDPAAGVVPTESAGSSKPIAKAGDSNNLGLVIGIAVGIVVLAIIGVLIVVLTSRRRGSKPDEPSGV